MEEIEKLSSMISNLLQQVENLDKKTDKIEKHCLENHAPLEKKISDLTKSSEANINELTSVCWKWSNVLNVVEI